MEIDFKQKVIDYYSFVDSEEIEKALEIFDKNVVYNRAGNIMEGIEQVEYFYKEKRKLLGKHRILETELIDKGIKIKGIFEGKINDQEIELEFTDIFHFNGAKVVKRETLISKEVGFDI